MRAFYAVEIPSNPTLSELLDDIRWTEENLKLVEPHNLHLTLKFLGDVPETILPGLRSALEKATTSVVRFEISIVGAGAFPRWSAPRVLWLGVEDSGRLADLATAIEKHCVTLGIPPETRPFAPHLTIARVKSGHVKRASTILQSRREERFGVVEIDRVNLKRSTLTSRGPVYEDIAVAQLPHRL